MSEELLFHSLLLEHLSSKQVSTGLPVKLVSFLAIQSPALSLALAALLVGQQGATEPKPLDISKLATWSSLVKITTCFCSFTQTNPLHKQSLISIAEGQGVEAKVMKLLGGKGRSQRQTEEKLWQQQEGFQGQESLPRQRM